MCCPFDPGCTRAYADLIFKAPASGLAISGADGCIAAMAAAGGSTVATRDSGPLEVDGIAVIDPWRPGRLVASCGYRFDSAGKLTRAAQP